LSLTDVLLGRPLASSEDQAQRIGPVRGVPIFGLDALSSAAYGPEAALTILLPLGLAGVKYIVPLSGAIILLLVIVYFSYRQTIAAYPQGGGSYTVARENLGERFGLLAAAALMIDYILNVAVGISAGVGALVSAVPALQAHTLVICLGILAVLTIVNLRGVREAGAVFMAPTYVFVGTLLTVIIWGAVETAVSGGHPHAAVSPPPVAAASGTVVGLWLLVKAFASGCAALTGVEAVSNGVQAFREDVVRNARITLTVIVAILVALLAGIAFLVHAYGIAATPPGQAGYQSVLSLLTAAVAGRGVFYGITMASILLVLCLSANTSFAGFPQLCRTVAGDEYLPRSFAHRGRRLVYSEGIWVLAILSGGLLILFGGVTDRLIPLFAVGAFLAFTLSQAGMVVHWKRNPGRGAHRSMWINGVGAVATGITVGVVLSAKFVEGAWVVVILMPAMLALMVGVHRHYGRVCVETAPKAYFLQGHPREPIVIVPVARWSSVAQKALRFALTLSDDIRVIHVEGEDDSLLQNWDEWVEKPSREGGLPVPKLIKLPSPFRMVIHPIVDHIFRVESENEGRTIAVVISHLVERHWYHYFLHNQRAELLTALLMVKGDLRITIVNVPWHLNA
jgi:amino acid transporter